MERVPLPILAVVATTRVKGSFRLPLFMVGSGIPRNSAPKAGSKELPPGSSGISWLAIAGALGEEVIRNETRRPRADVEKGSVTTAMAHGLVGPKALVKRTLERGILRVRDSAMPKGTPG